jgi:hypothetical protein
MTPLNAASRAPAAGAEFVERRRRARSAVVHRLARQERAVEAVNAVPVLIGSHGGTAEFFRGALDAVSVVIG